MGVWRRVGEWLGMSAPAPAATFSESTPRPIDQVIRQFSGGAAARVSRAEALSVPAVVKGRNLLCSIATLPLAQYGPDNRIVRHPLLEQIDPQVPNITTLSQTVEDLVFEGIAWWEITGYGFDGYPMTARRLDPAIVSVDPPAGRSPAPLPSGYDPRAGVVYVDGKPVSGRDIIRFDSPSPPVLKHAGRAIRRAIALDAAATMYANNPRPVDYFTPTDGADPVSDDDVAEILGDWEAARRDHSTGYVPAALTYNSVSQPTPQELQLVELQRQAWLEIANSMGVDPEDVGVSTTSRTYSNNVDRRRDRVNDVLSPFMRAITDRLSMPDVTKRGHTVRFDLDDYLRANPTERANVYKTFKDMGAITVDEIRAEEGWPPLPPGAAPTPTTPAPEPEAVDASRRAAATFDAPARMTFVDLPVTGFSVDTATREIHGLALPYGEVARKYGLKYRFEPGALEWSEVDRVKLLRDHDFAQPLGKALDLKNSDAGLGVRFKVARGAEGDRALELAEDGVLDGLSVGIDFDMAADTVPDPDDKDTVLIRRADLREVSLTAMPAFDSARVTKVAASRDNGGTMHCTTCGQMHAPDVACTASQTPAAPAGAVTLTADQFAALLAQAQAPAGPVEQRQVVNPVRTGVALVTEPAPYRFDARGNIRRGSHEFSTDLFAASKGDQAAYDRALSVIRERFDVDRTDVAGLNPNRQRPDMYVDQREYRYPVWQSISKGSLADSTPFVFPKFNSSSGLVAAHTEGVEPTPGAFTATTQTVTPTASSGKVELTREAWDQGGNPQMSGLIWRQMERAWYESLEAAAVAVLDAASPTQIDLSGTPGLADDDLDQALTQAFAALQFIRGGFSMDTGFAQIDLYKALVAAVDADGRRLYPALGPANATGTVRSRFASIDVNGVEFLPAWALAATGTVAASSYLFDSEVVHGWATSPQRLQFEYRVAYIDLAIWGYKATAISDTAGVREIVYDPS